MLQTLVVGALHKKELAVDELVSLLKDNKDALILDLAAGTGIIGQYVSLLGKQWRIQRGARDVPGQISFIFMIKMIGWCTPSGVGTHFWEILDPPLASI